MSRRFLTCYDYGQGGIWLYVEGESADQVRRDYPKLTVYENAPSFWTPELDTMARRNDPATSTFWAKWLVQLQNSN